MLPAQATIAIAATSIITWVMAAFLALFGLCNADPFGEYEGDLSQSIIEIKMDGPQVPTLQMAPPDDIDDANQRA